MALRKNTNKSSSKKKAIPVEELKSDVLAWLKSNDLFYDTAIYTNAEWKKRRERYGNDASLVVTTEGPLHGILNGYYDSDFAYNIQEGLADMLKDRGYWYDLGESWMILIYKL